MLFVATRPPTSSRLRSIKQTSNQPSRPVSSTHHPQITIFTSEISTSAPELHYLVQPNKKLFNLYKMPVIPNSSDFPSAPQKGGNEAEKAPGQQPQKATAADFLSKGPQIPDSKG